MLEFRIECGVGNVAASRNVEIMQYQRFASWAFPERNRDVARVDLVAEVLTSLLSNGSFEMMATP